MDNQNIDIDRKALRRQQEAEFQRRLDKHWAAGTTDFGPTTETVSPDFYTDPARWSAEKRQVFLREPLLACLTVDIPKPGDMTVFDAAGPSILIVRGKDGVVNAFLNVCTHRAATLVTEFPQNRKNMTCPFHGWVFGLDGKLLSALRQDAFDECDLVTRGLIRVPVGEWGGMVFIKAHAGDERIDVEAFLGEMALPLLGLELEKVFPVASDRLEIVGNWKFALDTYHESYHFDILHKETFQGTGFSGEICAINHYGRHHEFCFKGPQFTPEGMPAKPGDKDVVDTCGRDLVIFPNALINRYPLSLEDDIVSVHRVFPGDTMNKGFSIVSSYRSGSPVTEANREECEKTHQFLLYLLRQDDYRVVENSTANLNYLPSDFKLLLGRNEIIVQAMHRDLAIASGMPLPD